MPPGRLLLPGDFRASSAQEGLLQGLACRIPNRVGDATKGAKLILFGWKRGGFGPGSVGRFRKQPKRLQKLRT